MNLGFTNIIEAADDEVGGSGGGEFGALSLSIGLFDGLNE